MKKLLSVILAAAALCSSTTTLAVEYGAEYQNQPQQQTTQVFSDVPSSHWAFDYIGEMAQRGVIDGYMDGRFLPENQVTRAEFAKIMVCAAGLRVENNYSTSFADVYTSDWYCPYIECAKDYLNGYSTSSGTVYKPTTPALREDIAVALVKLKGYDTSLADESMLNIFEDEYSISSSARKYIAVAIERGIISGYDDNTFRGQATITRAEAATLLWRAFQYGNDNKVVDSSQMTSSVTATQAPTTSASDSAQKTTPTTSPTANPTNKPVAEQTAEKKIYKVETLNSVNLTYDFEFDGSNIYYIDGSKIYKMDPHSGSASNIYDTSKLTYQETEMQEKEVTKTVTKTVPIEKDEDKDLIEEDAETNAAEDTEQAETQEITEEVTEIVQEEVVVKEYSEYVPTQITYDKFNDRLIITGYYSRLEQPFKEPSEAEYKVCYDITNNERYTGLDKYKYIQSNSFSGIDRFISADNVIINNNGVYVYNTKSQSVVGSISVGGSSPYFWTVGNNVYYILYTEYAISSYYWSSVYKYNFSGQDDKICYLGMHSAGVNDTDVYYTDDFTVIKKVNLSNGTIDTLSLTADSEKCDITDMTPITSSSISGIGKRFIPLSDEEIVFYDNAAKAFRRLSKN